MIIMTKPNHPVIPATLVLLSAATIVVCGLWFSRPWVPAAGLPELADSPHTLTLEKIQTAIAAADARRLELLKADSALPNTEILDRWGIEVVGLFQAAGGRMLDFRYRVIDVDKASPLFDGRIKPALVDERNDAKLPVPMFPKIGALRTTNRGGNIRAGKIYTILFGGHIPSGERATVEIGDFQIEHLTVR